MEIKGLNAEQLGYIVDCAKNDKYPMDIQTEGDLFEYLDEMDDVARLDEDQHRWWITFTKIVRVGTRFFGFEDATSTGDNSPSDSGWERYDNEVCEYEETIIEQKTYKPKSA